MADVGLYLKRDNMKYLMEGIRTLTEHSVWVGFPENGEPRHEQGAPSNAYIAFIQEHGSPIKNIPARPFMIPGIRAASFRVTRLMEQAAIYMLNGDIAKYKITLNQIGLIGVASVQQAITVGQGWPPLKPATLAARRRRGRRGTHPLIDTNQLRSHITYVIRRKSRAFTFVDDNQVIQRMKRFIGA